VDPTQRYVASWALLGVLGILTIAAVAGTPRPDWVVVVTFLLVATIGERAQLVFVFPRARASFTLIEVAITAGLLLLPALHAVLVATLGTALAYVLRRASPQKVVFGASQAAVGMAVAAATLTLLPAFGPTIAGRSVLAATLGMCLYVAVNLAAIVGLFRRVAGEEAVEAVRDQIPLTSATMVGQIATGVVLAAIIEVDLALVPFVLAPAAAVYLAARGATRTTELLTNVRTDRDRLTRVIDGATDGILLLDRDATIQVWNPAMTRLTGVTEADAVGQPVALILHDGRRDADEPVRGRWLLDLAHEIGPRRELDAVLRDAEGSTRATRESHALVFDERGRCTGDVVVVRDVTRQQELERLRSDFVARVSHELRTPLTPIRGFASVLLRRGSTISDDQRREALERILERADHLGALVEDLLLVTRVDRGELEDVLHVGPVDLAAVVAPLLETIRAREPARTITATIAPGTGTALADEHRVTRILDALLDNACRYSPVDAPIEVDVEPVGDDIQVLVRDHGPGIPRQHRDTVFERFSRLEDPLTMRTSGVGLGLFIARQLAVAMHGSLELAPPGAATGAVFQLRLPASDPVVLRDVSGSESDLQAG
jgi:PAS domain S-box-containing protein